MIKKSVIILSIIIFLVLVGLVFGAYYYWPVKPTGVVCTREAKLCPDGSTVGRVLPKCDFTPCPNEPDKTAGWEVYRGDGFEFKYNIRNRLIGPINDPDILALGYEDKNARSGARVFISVYEGENLTPPVTDKTITIGDHVVYYSVSPFEGWGTARTLIMSLAKGKVNVIFTINYLNIINDFDVEKTQVFKEIGKIISTLKFIK